MKNTGFTLIELMAVVAVIGVMAAIGMPSLQNFITNNRISAEANNFVADIAFARSEAINRGATVTICPSPIAPNSTPPYACSGSTDWSIGRFIYVDTGVIGTFDGSDVVLRVREAGNGVTLASASGTLSSIQITATGNSNQQDTMTTCRTGYYGRTSVFQRSGRVSTTRMATTCP